MLYKDCARCKHLWNEVSQRGNCRGTAEWWSLNEIWLCRIQSLFLIRNLGVYPLDPRVSGYTEAEHTSTRIGANAPYEAESVLWAELYYRLERTGKDGRWLIDKIQSLPDMNIDWQFIIKQLPYEPKSALYYISGWRRKLLPFSDWVWEQKNRRKHGILPLESGVN